MKTVFSQNHFAVNISYLLSLWSHWI